MLNSSQPNFRYERIVTDINRLIDRGILKPGDRLPSVRGYSRKHGVSISTVLQAYRILEDRMLVEARPQSGFYVRPQLEYRPHEPGLSAIPLDEHQVSVSSLILEVTASVLNPEIVPLSAAIPSPELLPIAALNRMLASVARKQSDLSSSYLVPLGSEALRREISRRSLDWGCAIPADDILITCGCMEAVSLCLRVVAHEGSTIAVESPTYFGILQLIESLRMKALEIPTHPRTGISLDHLEQAFRQKKIAACIVMPTFHNPLGSVMSDSAKKSLVELATRYQVPLLEDDLYGDLHFDLKRPRVLKSFDTDNTVMYCGSFSKTLAPGYRVGWAVPGLHMEKLQQLKLASTLGTAAPTQLAIAAYLQKGGLNRHLRKLCRSFALNLEFMTEAVGRFFPEGTRVTRPRGGFVLWVELPKPIDSLALYRKALAHQISIAPGAIFSTTGAYSNFIRLNGGYPWSQKLEQALQTLGQLADSLLKSTRS